MPRLNIVYSPEFEVDRVRYTIGKLAWFREHSYNISMPATWDEKRNYSDEQIAAMVYAEYDPHICEEQTDYLTEHWRGIATECTILPQKLLDTVLNEYTVHLTRYGVGGSYSAPNMIITNIKFRHDKGLVENILHEMTHLAIEQMIEKNQISHWYNTITN